MIFKVRFVVINLIRMNNNSSFKSLKMRRNEARIKNFYGHAYKINILRLYITCKK